MPRIVNHDQRRAEFMAEAWKIIARAGLSGVTLRSVAAASGMANGALKPYFRSKEHLMLATFEYVMQQVEKRTRADAEGLSGFDAVRAFSLQVLPVNAELVDEAKVIIAFWALAAHDEDMKRVNDEAMGTWREWLSGWVEQQGAATGFRPGITVDILVDGLMTFLLGSQMSVTVDTVAVGQDKMSAHLDTLLNVYLPDEAIWELGRNAIAEAQTLRSAS